MTCVAKVLIARCLLHATCRVDSAEGDSISSTLTDKHRRCDGDKHQGLQPLRDIKNTVASRTPATRYVTVWVAQKALSCCNRCTHIVLSIGLIVDTIWHLQPLCFILFTYAYLNLQESYKWQSIAWWWKSNAIISAWDISWGFAITNFKYWINFQSTGNGCFQAKSFNPDLPTRYLSLFLRVPMLKALQKCYLRAAI